jgi:hypothetical protein
MAGLGRKLGSTLTLVALAGALIAGSSASWESGISAPPSTASPERVARVYLRAALAGDCALTAELTLPQTWSWCNDPRLLAYRSVRGPVHVPASQAGRNEECIGFVMDTDGSSDGTMPTGWQPWGLCLVKTHVGWRLVDQGQG